MAESEWEEVTMMLEVPDVGHPESRRPGESYIQILGLSSEAPLVKVQNQLYSGKIADTLGSHLFLEVEETSGRSAAENKKTVIKNVIVTDKSMKLEPVYLEPKKGAKHSLTRDQNESSQKDQT